MRFIVRFGPRLMMWLAAVLPARRFAVVPHREDAAMLRRRGLGSLDGLLSARRYHGSDGVRQAILALKYRCRPLTARSLADMVVCAVRAEKVVTNDAVLCPVPCTWLQRHLRGYNQTELLAWSVGRSVRLPVRRLLRRRRFAGSQTGRSRRERLSAQTDVFRIRRRATIPARVILIDDVATTGATLDACAKIWKCAGAECVEAWVVAHDAYDGRTARGRTGGDEVRREATTGGNR